MMKFHKLSYSVFVSLMIIGLMSCNDDDNRDLALSVQNISVLPEGRTSVEIINGNAPYTVVSDDEEIAVATVNVNTIDISGKKMGKVVLTVKDKTNAIVKLTVDVETKIYSFEIQEYLYAVEATDATVKSAIESELKENIPVPVGGRYEMEFLNSYMNDGNLKVYSSQIVSGFIPGTFQFNRINDNSIAILSYDNKEFTYLINPSLLRNSSPVTTLLFVEKMTEAYQTRYPGAGITRIERGQILRILK